MTVKNPNRSTRFRSESDPIALLAMTAVPKTGSSARLSALVLNESRTGCAVILVCNTPPQEGQELLIQLAKLPMTKAVIQWCKSLDKEVFKLGIKYIE